MTKICFILSNNGYVCKQAGITISGNANVHNRTWRLKPGNSYLVTTTLFQTHIYTHVICFILQYCVMNRVCLKLLLKYHGKLYIGKGVHNQRDYITFLNMYDYLITWLNNWIWPGICRKDLMHKMQTHINYETIIG